VLYIRQTLNVVLLALMRDTSLLCRIIYRLADTYTHCKWPFNVFVWYKGIRNILDAAELIGKYIFVFYSLLFNGVCYFKIFNFVRTLLKRSLAIKSYCKIYST